MAKITMTKNISKASKMYKYTSCEIRYPSLPASLQSADMYFHGHWYLHTLSIFDQAEHTTDPDENTASVERVQTPLPQRVYLHALPRGHADQASVEDPSGHDKAGEEYNLYHQATNNDVLSQSHGIEAPRCHDTTTLAKSVVSRP